MKRKNVLIESTKINHVQTGDNKVIKLESSELMMLAALRISSKEINGEANVQMTEKIANSKSQYLLSLIQGHKAILKQPNRDIIEERYKNFDAPELKSIGECEDQFGDLLQ